MRIYVVTKGEYSDYHIVAVATNLETAVKLAKRFTDRSDEARVEEYEEASPVELPMWHVGFDADGHVTRCDAADWSNSYAYTNLNKCVSFFDRVYVHVEAGSEEKAIKIAAEKRAEYLAQKEGLI